MKKKILIAIFIVVILILAICIVLKLNINNNNGGNIIVNCNNNTFNIDALEGEKFECELLSEMYTFTIKKVTDEEIVLKVNKPGLSIVKDAKIDLENVQLKFSLIKNEELKISTQTMDYGENISLNWN